MGISNPEKLGKRTVALIAGPTASGKSALALQLATKRPLAIINADSAQVYSDLPILSAQPTPAEMAQVPHYLFGYLDGRDPCSAARWAADAKIAIADAHDEGRLPVLVGGTGLYLKTLLDGIAPIPEIDPDLRAHIRAMPVTESFSALQAKDPIMAARLAPADSSRIARALEVITATGRSISEWRTLKVGGIAAEVELKPLILLPPREWLYARCDARFESMVNRGAVDEVAALRARQLPADAPVRRAIGVPELTAMLAGEMSRHDAITLGKMATRQYAKRQFTWFRNQAPPNWPRWTGELDNVYTDNFETILLK